MSALTLEERLAVVETKLEQLEHVKEQNEAVPWWGKIRGQFKDDPIYEEAMRLGREWRESEDPVREEPT